jgi:hypothetical protein
MLNWNTYPGALCYSVYQSVNPDDAFGQYKIVAECIPNPPFDLSTFGPGFFRVSAITLDGETPLSLPIHFNNPGNFQCPFFTGPVVVNPVHAEIGDTVTIGPKPVNEGFGGGVVSYEWRKNGLPYLDTTHTTKNSLEINNVDPTDSGNYSLQVSNEIDACDFIVSEDVELVVQPLFDIVWDAPFFRPGSPGSGTQSSADTRNSYHYNMTQPNGGVSPVDPEFILTGSQTYTGPAANCNFHMVVSSVTGHTGWDLEIKVDGVTVLFAANNTATPPNAVSQNGTFDFPFVIPESLGAVITIRASEFGQGIFESISIALDASFTKV